MQFISGHLGAAVSLVDLSFLSIGGTAANSGTYTFSRAPGVAHANRRMIIGFGFHSTVSTRTVSSITFDGVSGTVVGALRSHTSGGITAYAVFYRFNIPTGTADKNGQIVFSGSVDGLAAAYYRLVNSSATPHDTAFDTGASPSDTIDVPAGGGVIALVTRIDIVQGGPWSGISTNGGNNYDSTDNARAGIASDVFVDSQTGMTVSFTTTSATAVAMTAASWPV